MKSTFFVPGGRPSAGGRRAEIHRRGHEIAITDICTNARGSAQEEEAILTAARRSSPTSPAPARRIPRPALRDHARDDGLLAKHGFLYASKSARLAVARYRHADVPSLSSARLVDSRHGPFFAFGCAESSTSDLSASAVLSGGARVRAFTRWAADHADLASPVHGTSVATQHAAAAGRRMRDTGDVWF